MSERWTGTTGDGESWFVEIEHDRFSMDEPFVVSIWTEHEEGEGKLETLVTASPEQAREMAAALTLFADYAEKDNARCASNPTQGEEG